MTPWVFAYGTLKRGLENHPRVAPYVSEVRTGRIPGILVDLGGYPGWLPANRSGAGEETWVLGEVFRLSPVLPALRVLDALEEYGGPGDPANLYERVVVTVSTSRGGLRSWVYRYTGSVAGQPVVPGGCWQGVRGGP